MAIQSFACKQTKNLFEGKVVPGFANFRTAAERKLQQLDCAATLEFLRSPAGNHLEALRGKRNGQHSLRINAQYRICFTWTEEGPINVEIVDYH